MVFALLGIGYLVFGSYTNAASNEFDVIYPDVVIYHDSTNEDVYAELYAVKLENMIGHFRADVTVKDVEDYVAGDMDKYAVSFYIGTDFYAGTTNHNSKLYLTEDFYTDVANTTNTFVWFNYSIQEFLKRTNNEERLGMEYHYIKKYYDQVVYKDTELLRDDHTEAIVLQTNGTPVVYAYMQFVTNSVDSEPYVMRTSNFWYFADNPMQDIVQGGRSLVLADLMHDILGSGITTDIHRAVLRLEDLQISPGRIEDVNMVVSNLVELSVPATYGVITRTVRWELPEGETNEANKVKIKDLGISESPVFQETMQNIVRGNGDIIVHGYTHQQAKENSGLAWEFWNDKTKAPLTNDCWNWAADRLDAAQAEFMDVGVPVTVWETPHYDASLLDYNVIASRFRRLFERMSYCAVDTHTFSRAELEAASTANPTMSGQSLPYVIVQHRYGNAIIMPENLGYMSIGKFDSNGLERNVSNKVFYAERISVVRDGIAAGFFHPARGEDLLTNVVAGIRGAGFTYTSMLELCREFPLELNRSPTEAADDMTHRVLTSDVDINGDFVAGRSGAGNLIEVSSTAEVSCVNMFVGMRDTSSSNILSIAGAGTEVCCVGVAAAGLDGRGNSMSITNAGSLIADEGAVGYFETASNNTAEVSGAGSIWSNRYGFYVGPVSVGNRMDVTQGGELAAQFSVIGGSVDAADNIAVVDSGVWSNRLHLTVGRKGIRNELSITNGGCVYASYAFIGQHCTASNNSITVVGSNSCLSVEHRMTVGVDGGESELSLLDGGELRADDLVVGRYAYSTNNSVVVAGGFLNISNLIDVQHGNLLLTNGSAAAECLNIAASAEVHIYEGFDAGSIDIITNAGTIILHGDIDLPGSLKLVDGGVVQSDGDTVGVAGDYIELSTQSNGSMTNRMINFSGSVRHALQTTSQDSGCNLSAFAANHAFGQLGVNGTVDVVNAVYTWSLKGSGVLNLTDGCRFYYVDASGWNGSVNLSGDAVFEKVDVVLNEISPAAGGAMRLAWPAGSGILFSVEWVDNLSTGIFMPAASVRAQSNSLHWSDTGAVDRLPPQQVPTRFYRLNAEP